MKITVLGCGAMGQLWLTALSAQRHELQGWLRVPQPYCPVNLLDISGTIHNLSLEANNPQFLAETALLLVTLKAWQVSDALRPLLPILAAECPILLLHNGIGTQDELRDVGHPLLLGFTTQAARRDGRIIEHVASGITHIGPGNVRGTEFSGLADILHHALPDVAWHDDITSASWHKLAINCVINPLTAMYGCPNGALSQYPVQINGLCSEISAVMTREGIHISADTLCQQVFQVIHTTSQNTSSMLQDIRDQRHTEIDYITGHLLRRAHIHGIPVPLNTELYEQIKRKENDYERASASVSGPWE